MLRVSESVCTSPKANVTVAWGNALVVLHKSDFHWARPSGITTGSLHATCTNLLLSAGPVPGEVTTVAGAVA